MARQSKKQNPCCTSYEETQQGFIEVHNGARLEPWRPLQPTQAGSDPPALHHLKQYTPTARESQ